MVKSAAMSLVRARPVASSSLARSAELPTCSSRVSETCRRSFSVSTSQQYPRGRGTANGNRLRGMSAIKGTGLKPWIRLSVTKDDVKTPRDIKPVYKTDDNHGLWGFFRDRSLLTVPGRMVEHGRSWTLAELNKKSFQDLHAIYWACVKENSILMTESYTRVQLKLFYGTSEAENRLRASELTRRRIIKVLRDRDIAFTAARNIIQNDPSIVFSEDGEATYDPSLDLNADEGALSSEQPLEFAEGDLEIESTETHAAPIR